MKIASILRGHVEIVIIKMAIFTHTESGGHPLEWTTMQLNYVTYYPIENWH